MNRRAWLMAGVAGASGLLGAAWGVQRHRLQDVNDSATQALWQQRWDAPQGEPVEMARFRGRPLLVNFWATWCPPCVEELPMLNRFVREHRDKGWQVLALAVDQPSAVRRFMERTPLEMPVGLAGLDGTEWSKRLGNPNGGLPFTVVLDAQGRLVQRKLGKLSPEDLSEWVRTVPAR